ncbi:hypothetical protein HPB52_003425 [Rhipicephalus sanguineus]|uniref:BPTI/Kunitz inhibitor domain-containing protein n=1 Tax=Rhipicephalus sanguineus TaxID=34632 RepID=A0A9D4PHU4_RHISA|nr:hypothetical protein HPB52_003425 [Rhipicephalus sanguineus]
MDDGITTLLLSRYRKEPPMCSLWGPDNASGIDESVCFNTFYRDCPGITQNTETLALRGTANWYMVPLHFQRPPGVQRTAIAPPPVAKALAPATAPHARGDALLRAVSSADLEMREQETTARIIAAQGNPGNKTVEHSGVLAKNSRAAVSSGAAGSEEGYRHHLCDIVFYTHCPRTAREFYFSSSTNSCVRATTSYGAEVCNRSPNKFASEASCHKSCVHPSTPSGRCLDRPVFSQCRSADLKRRLWFFEGEACQPWDFPFGRCPMDDGDLFGSREECAHRCLENQTYLSLCRTPPSGTCTTHHLNTRCSQDAVSEDVGAQSSKTAMSDRDKSVSHDWFLQEDLRSRRKSDASEPSPADLMGRALMAIF